MHSEFTIFHLEHAQGSSPDLTPKFVDEMSALFSANWKTCLRHIGFSMSFHTEKWPPCSKKVTILQGREAYEFCLEVICGLHSPLLGETEVLGQFKDFTAEYKISGELPALKKIFDSLIEDAKKVRQKHLINLGSQSYGSLVRRYLKEDKGVHILGAGRLVRDIVPWLKTKQQIHIFCRSPQKAHTWTGHFKNVTASPLKEAAHSEFPLVVAAPMAAEDILGWLDFSRSSPSMIIDLRESSETDPLVLRNVKVLKLTELFKEIQGVQSQLSQIVEQAQQLIKVFASERHQTAAVRPFGWDDLCA
jgi:glutamyl-tRNA reductase